MASIKFIIVSLGLLFLSFFFTSPISAQTITPIPLCTEITTNCGGVNQQCCLTSTCGHYCTSLLPGVSCDWHPPMASSAPGTCVQSATPTPPMGGPSPTSIIAPPVNPAPTVPPGTDCEVFVCAVQPCSCPGNRPIDCMASGGGAAWCCASSNLCPGYVSTTSGYSCTINGNLGINTALGCIVLQGNTAFTAILSWATGIAGGIAFILIVLAALQIVTATGDPKRVKAGQELITSAIAGFILIALAVVILNFLGVNVLGLQNLGFHG